MGLWAILKEWRNAQVRTHNYTCDICGREVFGEMRICSACAERLPWNDRHCPHCGRAVLEEGICLECKAYPLSVKSARSVLVYEGEGVNLVQRLKRGSRYLKFVCGQLLLPYVTSEFSNCNLIVGVPMTEKSRKKRGFNQSYLIARELAQLSGREYAQPCIKIRDTIAQKSLGGREREENLKGCFHVENRGVVKGKRILIVDDALTTGSTVSALAIKLKRAGAIECYALTVASVPQKMFKNRERVV